VLLACLFGVAALGGLTTLTALHHLLPRRCEWLGEAAMAPLLVVGAGLAVPLYRLRLRRRWLVLALLLLVVAADSVFNLGGLAGRWLLLHPTHPIHRLDRAMPGLCLYTWPEMVLEAALLTLGLPVGLAILWELRADRSAAAAFLAAGALALCLFVVLLAGSGAARHLPFRLGTPAVAALWKDATEFLMGLTICWSLALYWVGARRGLKFPRAPGSAANGASPGGTGPAA
jgi:hypothetical protein